jgi:hypothetical protein
LKSKFDHAKVVGSKVVYNKHDRLVIEDVLGFADGSKHEWVYFKTSGAVAVAALTDNNRIVLTKQYRHPMRKVIFDLQAAY